MKLKRTLAHLSLIASALLAMSLAFAPMTPAYASLVDDLAQEQEQLIAYEREHGMYSGRDWAEAQWRTRNVGLTAQAEEEPLPEKFDLRDRGVVTPVKSQSPWGSCWAFGAIAASETSILSELGLTYDEFPLDLSERQLAWFSSTPLPDAQTLAANPFTTDIVSQAEEGITTLKRSDNPTKNPLNTGGTPFYATTLFASGTGPLLEEEAPYRNEENIATVKLSPQRDDPKLFQYDTPFDPDSEESAPYDEFTALRKMLDFDNIPVDDLEALEESGILDDPDISDILEKGLVIGTGVRQKVVTDELVQNDALDNYAARPLFDENGLFVCAENNNLRDYDWGLPFSKRFALSAELEESTCLPSPAAFDLDYNYFYDASATAAIKRELMAGRGVHIEFCADQSRPGQQVAADSYLNPNTWSHYSYDKTGQGKRVSLNHDVCIVGWDDNWGVENFNQGTYYNADYGVEVNRFPPAPGAWIVKNSWGAKGRGFPNESDWGIDGSGYFYLSYYDMSIIRPTAYNFYTQSLDSEREELFVNQYDFLSCYDVQNHLSLGEASTANVFTAQDDQLVRTLSVETDEPNTHVVLSLYRLHNSAVDPNNEAQPEGEAQDETNPTAGDLLETVTADYPNGGYHRLHLPKSHYMAKGQRFSIVCTMTVETAEGLQYAMPVRSWYNAHSQENPDYDSLSITGKGVVNKGESFVLSEGTWKDWTSVVADLQAQLDGIRDYDNFALKAFADANIPFTLRKEVVDPKEVYYPGDEVHYRVSVKNDGSAQLDSVVIADSLVELGENGRIESVPAGDERSIEYVYKVTDEDAARGSVGNVATATLENVEGISATADASVTCAARPAPTPEPAAPAPAPAPRSAAAVTTRTTQPATSRRALADTGDRRVFPISLTLVATALGTFAFARRLRRQ